MNHQFVTRTFVLYSAMALASGSLLARDLSIDYTQCYAGVVNLLHASKELTSGSYDLKGIVRSNTDDKTLDNQTMHCVGAFANVGGNVTDSGYCKFVSGENDSYVGTYVRTSTDPKTQQGTWRLLGGTGKWQGITGEATYLNSIGHRPVAPGTFQQCGRVTGKYRLPS